MTLLELVDYVNSAGGQKVSPIPCGGSDGHSTMAAALLKSPLVESALCALVGLV